MKKSNIILAGSALAALIIIGISAMVLSGVSRASKNVEELDKAKVIHDRSKEFLKEGNYDRAANALSIIANEYPDSQYAETSLRELISIYIKKGDGNKAGDYYDKLITDFPETKDMSNLRLTVEDLNMKAMTSLAITDDSVEYTVQSGDSLFVIAKKFKTTVELIKKVNGLKSDLIRLGQRLKIITSEFSIFVDKSDNILVLKKDGKHFKMYKVSTGKDNSTPVGISKIEEKMVKPTWYKVGAIVSADSKEYELGERWMGLSVEGYGIHGTSDESTIGNQVTQGCVRMYNADVVELFEIVPSGTVVEIVD